MLGDAGQPADAFRPGAVIAAARAVYRGRGAENHLFGVGEPCRRRAMNGQGEGGHSNQAVVLASYAECCEQVRHNEAQRDRANSMVASTTGVMLVLLGFKDWKGDPTCFLIAFFIL